MKLAISHPEPGVLGGVDHAILLVDGNSSQRAEIQELLANKFNHRITEAASGDEALKRCREVREGFAVILIDLNAIENRYNTIIDLKTLMPEALIIVIVQNGDYQRAAEALLMGAYDFLAQPLVGERLGAPLRNALAFREARREARRNQPLDGERGRRRSASLQYTGETLISLLNSDGDARQIKEIELAAIRFAVHFYNGRMTEVARKLGIGRSTLYRKLGAVG